MEKIECVSCGKVLGEKDSYWILKPDGIVNCIACMNYPLHILRNIFYEIAQFDNECEVSFLEPTEEERKAEAGEGAKAKDKDKKK